jgi:hypothetical protein
LFSGSLTRSEKFATDTFCSVGVVRMQVTTQNIGGRANEGIGINREKAETELNIKKKD